MSEKMGSLVVWYQDALAWARLWKRAAKKYRERYHECHDSYMRLCDIYDSTKNAQANADRRLEWMEKLRWNGNDGVMECPWCHLTPRTHVPCEFSKELGDE